MGILRLNDDERIFESRIEDLVDQCDKKSIPVYSSFLSEREAEIAKEVVCRLGKKENILFFGGFDEAERSILGVFPDYSMYCEREELLSDFPICVINAECSGFRTHTHRDFLGSLLALGIQRDVLGDILPSTNGYSAVLFVHRKIAEYVLENLTLVGRDRVKMSLCENFDKSAIKREYQSINATVASLRTDAVISELLNLSREKSQLLITQDAVAVNHRQVEAKSHEIKVGDTISVRGYGKYKLSKIGDINRKGRIRITVLKFI